MARHRRDLTPDEDGLHMSSTTGAKHVPVAVPSSGRQRSTTKQTTQKGLRYKRKKPRSGPQRCGPVSGPENEYTAIKDTGDSMVCGSQKRPSEPTREARHTKDKEDPPSRLPTKPKKKRQQRHDHGTPNLPKEHREQQQATYSCLTTVSTASFIASATRCTVDVVSPAILIRPLLVM